MKEEGGGRCEARFLAKALLGGHLPFRGRVTEGLVPLSNQAMYFGSLEKVVPALHTMGCT
jgi:hypothetical protein